MALSLCRNPVALFVIVQELCRHQGVERAGGVHHVTQWHCLCAGAVSAHQAPGPHHHDYCRVPGPVSSGPAFPHHTQRCVNAQGRSCWGCVPWSCLKARFHCWWWCLTHSTLLAPSSKVCQNWLHHWRGTLYLQADVHQCCKRPLKGVGTNKTGGNIASKHACKHEVTSWVKKEVSSRFKWFCFCLRWHKQHGQL